MITTLYYNHDESIDCTKCGALQKQHKQAGDFPVQDLDDEDSKENYICENCGNHYSVQFDDYLVQVMGNK